MNMATPYVSASSIKRLPKQIKILVLLIVSVLLIGTIGFSLLGNNPTGAFITTTQTLAHVSKAGPSTPLEGGFSLFIQFIGVIIIWFSIWAAFDLAVAGKFEEYFQEVGLMKQVARLKSHYIICGAGRVGLHLGERLVKEGKTVIFVDKDETAIEALRSKGFIALNKDVLDEKSLLEAGIQKADTLAAVLNEDSDNLLLILTAKELNPNIRIAARAGHERMVVKLRHAGADLVVLPEVAGGVKLADALLGKSDRDYIIVR